MKQDIKDFETSCSNNLEVKYYDLSTPISENTVAFPGDPQFQCHHISSLEKGDSFNLCQMLLGNHTGTHIDYPAHLIKGAKTSSDFPVNQLIGTGLIIELPNDQKAITRNFLMGLTILNNDIVFFKTANSLLLKSDKFDPNYVYIETDAAEELIILGVKIIGIDYINVDKYGADNLPVHHIFLSNEILIVEGLELNNVPLGRCEIFILPLNIPNMDGLPARVIARV